MSFIDYTTRTCVDARLDVDMKHKLEKFEICVDKASCMPGEIIKGSVSLTLLRPINAKYISVHFEGEGLAKPTNSKNKYVRQFMHFDEKIAVFDKSVSSVQTAFATPGKHTFFFRYRIPKNLPTSFSYSTPDHTASINYSVYARVKIPKKFNSRQIMTRIGMEVLKRRLSIDNVQGANVSLTREESKFDLTECTYMFTPLNLDDSLGKRGSAQQKQGVTRSLSSSGSDSSDIAYDNRKLSDVSDVSSSNDCVFDDDCMSMMSTGSDNSRRSSTLSNLSESELCKDRLRHSSFEECPPCPDEVTQEYIVRVLRACDGVHTLEEITEGIEKINKEEENSPDGTPKRKNSLFKTVIVL